MNISDSLLFVEFRGESYHQFAATKIFNQTSGRKKTNHEEMSTKLTETCVLEYIFGQTKTANFAHQRLSEAIPLSDKLDGEFTTAGEKFYTFPWNFDDSPESFAKYQNDCLFKLELVQLAKKLYCDTQEDDDDDPISLTVGTAILFENALFEQTRFASEKAIRLRCHPEYKSDGPWFDGFMALFKLEGPKKKLRKPFKLPCKLHITHTADAVRYVAISAEQMYDISVNLCCFCTTNVRQNANWSVCLSNNFATKVLLPRPFCRHRDHSCRQLARPVCVCQALDSCRQLSTTQNKRHVQQFTWFGWKQTVPCS